MSTEGEPRRSNPVGGEPTAAAEPPAPEPIELPSTEPSESSGSTGPAGTGEGPDEPAGTVEEPTGSTGEAEPPPARRPGRVSYQDPDSTTPREPTLAERRARLQAQRQEEEAEEQRLADEARKAKTRKRVMI
ncbi:MAG: hypothetical protein QOC75_3260, partial [Pseudonocardiales bacterium]|nr:hypothetical protein [Pseudonocardiales bacterium]